MGENKKCTSCEKICLEKIAEILNSIPGKGENIDKESFIKLLSKELKNFFTSEELKKIFLILKDKK